jgi:NADH:ubiquinone oxidoreductase subunit 5 (subunit L)/multisubunit Na+/H+ antiporter MnhA subunit
MAVGQLQIEWALRVDALTAVMLVVVTSVSALVHLYSWGYMARTRISRASSRTSRCSPSRC